MILLFAIILYARATILTQALSAGRGAVADVGRDTVVRQVDSIPIVIPNSRVRQAGLSMSNSVDPPDRLPAPERVRLPGQVNRSPVSANERPPSRLLDEPLGIENRASSLRLADDVNPPVRTTTEPAGIHGRPASVADEIPTSRLNFKIVGPRKNDAVHFSHLPEQYHQKASEMIHLSGNAYEATETTRYGYNLFAKKSGFLTEDLQTFDHATGDPIHIPGLPKEADWLGYKIFTKATDSGHEIVISFRGSKSPSDFLTDLDFFKTPLRLENKDFGLVHNGFKQAYEKLRPDYLRDLAAAKSALGENVKVTVTGHSLGGSLATLSAVDLQRNFNHLYNVDNLFTFGGPRIGDAMFEDILEKSLKVHGGADVVRVAMLDRNGNADLVSMMPPLRMGFSDPKTRFSITDTNANCPRFKCRATILHSAYFD